MSKCIAKWMKKKSKRRIIWNGGNRTEWCGRKNRTLYLLSVFLDLWEKSKEVRTDEVGEKKSWTRTEVDAGEKSWTRRRGWRREKKKKRETVHNGSRNRTDEGQRNFVRGSPATGQFIAHPTMGQIQGSPLFFLRLLSLFMYKHAPPPPHTPHSHAGQPIVSEIVRGCLKPLHSCFCSFAPALCCQIFSASKTLLQEKGRTKG